MVAPDSEGTRLSIIFQYLFVIFSDLLQNMFSTTGILEPVTQSKMVMKTDHKPSYSPHSMAYKKPSSSLFGLWWVIAKGVQHTPQIDDTLAVELQHLHRGSTGRG
jgi:hypothetical protein